MSDEDDAPVTRSKKRKTSGGEPPKWFTDYLESQQTTPVEAEPTAADDEGGGGVDADGSDEDYNEANSYFETNTTEIQKTVLSHVLAHLSEKQRMALRGKIKKGVAEAFELLKTLVEESYTGLFSSAPTSNLWKLGLGPEEIKRYTPMLRELRDGIERKSTININKILDSGCDIDTKQKLLQMFDILQALDPYSIDYVNLAANINGILEHNSRVVAGASEKLKHVEEEMKRLSQTDAPLKTRILQSDLDPRRKAVIYERWLQYEKNPADSLTAANLEEWIEEALRTPFTRIKETALTTESPGQCLIKLKQGFSTRLSDMDSVLEPLLTILNNRLHAAISRDRAAGENKAVGEVKVVGEVKAAGESKAVGEVKGVGESKAAEAPAIDPAQLSELVKQRISGIMTSKDASSSIVLGLLGSPGVGKTSIGKVISEVWGMPFVQISLGGIIDSGILDGQHMGWVGSGPGRICKAIQEMGVTNGILFFDEIDKLGDTSAGLQVQHSLLHTIDPVQNKEYHDHYLGPKLPIDLSKCIIICALNKTDTLDPALLSRMNIIEIPDYTKKQKRNILIKHLFPAVLRDAALTEADLTLDDDGVKEIIRVVHESDPNDGGVRGIKNCIRSIVDKLGLLLRITPAEQKELKLSFTIAEIPAEGSGTVVRPVKITPEIIQTLVKSDPVDVSYKRLYT